MHDTNFNKEIFSENKNAFENAKSFMKAPIAHKPIEDDEFPFSGGSCSTNQDLPTKDQEDAAVEANTKMNQIFTKSDELINIPTFDSDSTEVAKPYIDAIYKFEEAQDNFFDGFLSNEEPNNLEDYFKETLI